MPLADRKKPPPHNPLVLAMGFLTASRWKSLPTPSMGNTEVECLGVCSLSAPRIGSELAMKLGGRGLLPTELGIKPLLGNPLCLYAV